MAGSTPLISRFLVPCPCCEFLVVASLSYLWVLFLCLIFGVCGRFSVSSLARRWSMCKALEDLAIPHSIKAWREGDAQSWLACVHVVMDWGFARYEKERASRALCGNSGSNAAILPPLLRGNSWRLSISGQGGALPSPMSVDGSPRPSKAQRGGNDSPMAWSGSSSGEGGGGGGAEAGTVWKFKMLSYMRRTFLCRNCSGDLAATGNVAAYHKRLVRLSKCVATLYLGSFVSDL